MTTSHLRFCVSLFVLSHFVLSAWCADGVAGRDGNDGKDRGDCQRRCKREAGGRKEYAAIIDGGSSGSRIRVYEWESIGHDARKALPAFKEIFNERKKPGVSDYAEKPTELEKYLKELINSALGKIPEGARSKTDLYFMATAGMRLLLEDKANSMIDKIDRLFANGTFQPLRYRSPDNSRILSGEEEGVFAWIAVNYLKNVFTKRNVRTKKTYGILELGGASTQIAFAPTGNILADKFPILISGVNYDLYVHSYLYYGQNYVDQWVKTALLKGQNRPLAGDIPNPCMVKGDVHRKQINGEDAVFSGTGSYQECQEVLNEFVYRVHEEWKCHPKPCAIGTVYQPTINPKMEFVAIGAFVHPFNKLKVLPETGKFSYLDTKARVEYFCGLSKEQVLREYPPDEDAYTSVPCLMGTYSPMLFIRGYNFRKDTDQIYVKKDIDGQSADWTLGAVIYEYERRPKDCDCQCSSSPAQRTLVDRFLAALLTVLSLLRLYLC